MRGKKQTPKKYTSMELDRLGESSPEKDLLAVTDVSTI